MSWKCNFCGALIEDDTKTVCPYCGAEKGSTPEGLLDSLNLSPSKKVSKLMKKVAKFKREMSENEKDDS
ncbi:hypothetical protein [Mesoaciditoga lauensis]|uniref:hypothetical protein n=1 Tax=Mesoaciditoga lauensis TaxID=1495039 RepID=UPI00055FC101|nr:hypothetical protein [Mesoaciditoga lauensis]